MRNITLYTDVPLVDSISQRYAFERIDPNGDGPEEEVYIQYTTSMGKKGITAIERAIEQHMPDLNYTIVVEKREVPNYRYLLVELPDRVDEETHHEFVQGIISDAMNLFAGAVSVGDVSALPNQTPEQVLSIVIGNPEEEQDE